MTRLQMKWTGVAAMIALALFLLYPSMDWYTKDAAQRERLEASRLRPRWLLPLACAEALQGARVASRQTSAPQVEHLADQTVARRLDLNQWLTQ